MGHFIVAPRNEKPLPKEHFTEYEARMEAKKIGLTCDIYRVSSRRVSTVVSSTTSEEFPGLCALDVEPFSKLDINDAGPEWDWPESRISFSEGMIGRCEPLFDELDGNYDVEDLLRAHGVIRKNQKTDTEYCCMYVYFSSLKVGHNFIKRLNAFLEKRAQKVLELRRW